MATGTSHLPGTLPPQTSGFVGRAAELARTRELLRGSRLVTITGVGGVGKTRLAVRAAADVAGDYRDGVHFVELSSVRNPELLVHNLAAVFAVTERAGAAAGQSTQLDVVLGYLRERALLLILDTCEHLIDTCAALADTVLREAPGVTILATSRQPLDAPGESVQLLHSLPVPGAGSATAGKADAVELFEQRAAAAVPGFRVGPGNLAEVITVCERLDGIPLAIELATVRLRALPLHEMAERIDDRLRLLTGGRRSGTERHQTLRAAIEWSHDLCTPAEQLLWARLSVFAGAFDLAAAEAVCPDHELSREEVEPTLAGLVDKSLVARESATGAGPADTCCPPAETFCMLNTIREFGAERLRLADTRAVVPWQPGPAERSGLSVRPGPSKRADRDAPPPSQAEASVRGRFIAHYLALAEEFDRDPGNGQLDKLRRLAREQANLRAAFEYALDLPGNDAAAVVLATSLCLFWYITSQLREGEYWLDRALQRCPKGSVVRARVLAARSSLRIYLGDVTAGTADAEAAIEAAVPFADLATAGRGYNTLVSAHAFTRNLAGAQAAAKAAAECYTRVGDMHGLARLALTETSILMQADELDQCYEVAARGLDQLPDDEVWCSSYLHGVQSMVLFLQGDLKRAKSAALTGLTMKQQIHDVIGTAFALCALSFMAAAEGRRERTAWLLGAAAPLWEGAGRWYIGDPIMQRLHEAAERIARDGLGDEAYWELRAAGAAVPLDHAVKRALDDADTLGEPAVRR